MSNSPSNRTWLEDLGGAPAAAAPNPPYTPSLLASRGFIRSPLPPGNFPDGFGTTVPYIRANEAAAAAVGPAATGARSHAANGARAPTANGARSHAAIGARPHAANGARSSTTIVRSLVETMEDSPVQSPALPPEVSGFKVEKFLGEGTFAKVYQAEFLEKGKNTL